jgi:hypothetical protein
MIGAILIYCALCVAIVLPPVGRSEYEIGCLAGYFGVPESIDSLDDTGDIEELRGLKKEYVALRGPKKASAMIGFK